MKEGEKMEKLVVSEACNGCGLCNSLRKYFEENDEGNAVAKSGVFIEAQDEIRVNDIISRCPVHAIKKINVYVKDDGDVLKNLIEEMEKELATIKVERLKRENMPFKMDEYSFSFPNTSPHEITSKYSTESATKSAAKNDFDRLVYGSAARDTEINRILVEYKVKYALPFYSIEKNDTSYYYKMNKRVENVLSSYYASFSKILGNKFTLQNEWKAFDCYPRCDALCLMCIKDFPVRTGFTESIWRYVRDLGPTSLSDYVDYMDFDYFENWVGTGLFGRDITKKEWSFTHFRDAVKEYCSDLKSAFNYHSDEIEDFVVGYSNSVLEGYESEMRKSIAKKIEEVKKMLFECGIVSK